MTVKKVFVTGAVLLGLLSFGGLNAANASSYGSWRTPSQQEGHDSWVEGQDDTAYNNGYISKSEKDTEDSSLNADREAQESKMASSKPVQQSSYSKTTYSNNNNNQANMSKAKSTKPTTTIKSGHKSHKLTANKSSKTKNKPKQKKTHSTKVTGKTKLSANKASKTKHSNHHGLIITGVVIVILIILGFLIKLIHKHNN